MTTSLRVALALSVGMALLVGRHVAAQPQPSKTNLHVSRVFSEGQTTAGFFPVENISADCLWNLMYVDLSSPAGRGQLALLMQAKSQGLELQRVDYSRNVPGYTAGTCLATGIHIQ